VFSNNPIFDAIKMQEQAVFCYFYLPQNNN